MTPERFAELRDKVAHGYNLINSEAREVFEAYGDPIEPQARCQACGGEGSIAPTGERTALGYVDSYVYDPIQCEACNGTGYVPVVGEVGK